ncbi:MAG: GGDEF domain-containing protein [Treponema sp.]|nr:GGDEF domain-containing protein [Treponema sp.]
MRRRLMLFSSILFLFILILGSAAFIFLMSQIIHTNFGNELRKTVEVERLRLEAFINGKIAIVLKMADSPLIKRYFSNPDDLFMEQLAFDEIGAYSRALLEKNMFWINDKDKIFYSTGFERYTVDPQNEENYWYNLTLHETDAYNININYNPDLETTNLWINAPVFNNENIPIGIVGAGIDLTYFISSIFLEYTGDAVLYFFNNLGEVTGARNINLVKEKINIEHAVGHQTAIDIMDRVKNLINGETILFDINNANGITALGTIDVLDWYIAAVHRYTIHEALQTGMTILFAVMIIIIFSVFAVFNIFVARLLEPLHRMVNEISRLSGDWELSRHNEISRKDEIGTLGEFLNMTIIDPLTGIYNRRFFDGNMKKIIKSLSRTESKLSLLMIDIDFFKKYNDTYGHDKGDNCLREVAQAISKCIIREDDFTARYGGEEFAVVLPNTDENGAAIIADKLLKKVYSCGIPHETSAVSDFVTVSIGGTTGIVNFSHEETDYIKYADSALYKSKNSGRNRYTFEEFR